MKKLDTWHGYLSFHIPTNLETDKGHTHRHFQERDKYKSVLKEVRQLYFYKVQWRQEGKFDADCEQTSSIRY